VIKVKRENLFAYALISAFVGLVAVGFYAEVLDARGEHKQEPFKQEPFTPSPYDARLIALDREALDAAYRQQLAFLFTTWMKDEHGQPQRAQTGAARARRAYVAVMKEIEERERRQ
jgi:hypothetical protein